MSALGICSCQKLVWKRPKELSCTQFHLIILFITDTEGKKLVPQGVQKSIETAMTTLLIGYFIRGGVCTKRSNQPGFCDALFKFEKKTEAF